MKKIILPFLALGFMVYEVHAQVKIGENPTSINPNSLLELESGNRGLLLPRLTKTKMNAMENAPAGMLVYNITDSALSVKRDTGWVVLAAGISTWAFDGNNIYNTNAGNVGIGTVIPKAQLHTTGAVRFDILKGNGVKLVYANDDGTLVSPAAVNNTVYDIPQNQRCPGLSSSLTISNMPSTIPSANIRVKINITHNFNSDLLIYLVSPSGQTLNLAYQNGGATQDFINTIFSDAAPNSINTGTGPFTGSFKPRGNRSAECSITTPNITTFAGFGGGVIVPNGTWTLKVIDNSPEDEGTLQNWSISFDGTDPGNGIFAANFIPKGLSNGSLADGSIYDNGNIGIGTGTPSAKLEVNGFTKLGSDAPALKTLELSGILPDAQGQVFISHGLTDAKIMSVAAMVSLGTTQVPPNYTLGSELYGIYIDNGRVAVKTGNSLSSYNVYGQPIRILIVYKE